MTMTTTTEVVPYNSAPLAERYEYARQLSGASDLIPRGLWAMPLGSNGKPLADCVPMPSPAKILLVLETGAMLGLHPIAALQNVYIVDGKTAMSAQLMAAIVRSKGYALRVYTEGTWGAEFKAIAELTRPGESFVYRVEWTLARAERAALLGKDNWQHYPESMAKARAISEVVREGGQDALLGVVYTPEELGASVTEDGAPIIGEDGEAKASAIPVEAAAPSATPPARKRATNGTQGTKRKAPTLSAEPEPEREEPGPVDGKDAPEQGDVEEPPTEPAADEPPMATYAVSDGTPEGTGIVDAKSGEMSDEAKLQWEAKRKRDAEREEAAAAEAQEAAERAAWAAEQEEAAKAASEAPAAAEEVAGEVEETQAEMDARIKTERAARKAADDAEPELGWPDESAPLDTTADYERVTKNPPNDEAELVKWYWERVKYAPTSALLKTVWDQASMEQPSKLTTEMRLEIIRRKGELDKAAKAAS